MNLKELLFGGGVQSGDSGGAYRDSIQAWLPIKNIIGGVVITKDNRFVKILEVLPVNIYLKSTNDRQNIISSFAAYLKIAPNDLQMIAAAGFGFAYHGKPVVMREAPRGVRFGDFSVLKHCFLEAWA